MIAGIMSTDGVACSVKGTLSLILEKYPIFYLLDPPYFRDYEHLVE